MRLDLIIRTSKRKRDARSPQQQRDMAESCAQTNGYEIASVHDSGTDESGKTMNRASIEAAMARVQAGETDGVIVALADRIGRAPIEEAMTTVRAFCSAGKLVIADMGGQPLDLNNGVEESNVVFQLQMARQFWLNTANRMRRSQRDAIEAGKYVGPTPFGYRRRGGRLYPHPERAPIVREAYRLAAYKSLHAAVDYLRAEAPGRRWDTDAVRRLLAARVYLGESRVEHEDETLLNEHAHDALTTPRIWLAAQTDPRMRRSNGAYLLSHRASCGKCGAGLVGALQSVNGRRYRRMRCSNPECRGGSSISADKLEMRVRVRVAKRLGDDRFRRLLDPVGLEDAERELQAAIWDREQYLEGTAGLPAAAIKTGAAKRQAAVEAAQRRYREVAETSARCDELPAANEVMKHDAALLRAIGAGVTSIIVRPGRGDIAERVRIRFVGDDFDDGAGVVEP